MATILLTDKEIGIEIEELRKRIPEFERGLYLLVKSSNKTLLKKIVEFIGGSLSEKKWEALLKEIE